MVSVKVCLSRGRGGGGGGKRAASYPDMLLINLWARKGGRERERGSPRFFFLPVVHRASRSSRETPEEEAGKRGSAK